MKKIKSHFSFSKQERSGIFFLLLIIVVLQAVFYLLKYTSNTKEGNFSLDREIQVKIDSLKLKSAEKDSVRIFPFNPNFISDYKGYTLGLSTEEIDRLHAYRVKNLFVNSAEEFQSVTKISDSLLYIIRPYFKFPDWASSKNSGDRKSGDEKPQKQFERKKEKIQFIDLNNASASELKSVNGIGDKLSQRIIKFRDRLGGFIVEDQLYDVYGLEPDVVKRTFERFKILSQPQIEKINVNSASAEEISKLIYIRYNVATRIVEYREVNGSFSSFDELTKIEDFPIDKIHRIQLYLTL